MSCLDKLGNNPTLNNLDSNLKSIAPSQISGLSTGLKAAKVGSVFKSIATDIKNSVTAQVNNILGQVTGAVSSTIKQVKNLSSSLKSLPQSFVNQFKAIGNALSKQAKAVAAFIECEVTSTRDSITNLFETSQTMADISSTSVNEVSTVSNSVAKSLSENTIAREAFIDQVSISTTAVAEKAALTAKSNKVVVAEQQKTIDNTSKLIVSDGIPEGYSESTVNPFKLRGRLLLVKNVENDTFVSNFVLTVREYDPFTLKQITPNQQKEIERINKRGI